MDLDKDLAARQEARRLAQKAAAAQDRLARMPQEKLARHVCMDKCNVTRHLAKLEEGGYVERRSSETDRRVTLVYPTDKLEELVPTIREINQEWTNYVMEGLSEEEIAQFEATLLKIARRAKEYVNSKDEIET